MNHGTGTRLDKQDLNSCQERSMGVTNTEVKRRKHCSESGKKRKGQVGYRKNVP